jgi:hypothetical protein
MNHYVYLIEKKTALDTEQKYYIGVRSCESKIGDDDYMGSSKYLTEDIGKTGKQHYNKIILKRFDNRKDAMNYEIELHEKFDVVSNPLFFNKAKQKTTGFSCGPKELNPFYGKKHTEEYKQRLSALLKTKNTIPKKTRKGEKHSFRTLQLMSVIRKTWIAENKHPMLGVKRTEEMKINSSLGAKNQQKYKCDHCDVVTIPANIKRWHNDNCKKKV